MTARTWIGGGDDRANNPADWSPTGVPQAGDFLLMPPTTTMSVQGNDLAGDRLILTGSDAVVPLEASGSPEQPLLPLRRYLNPS